MDLLIAIPLVVVFGLVFLYFACIVVVFSMALIVSVAQGIVAAYDWLVRKAGLE